MADTSWLTARADGVDLVIHARPGARRSELAGVHGTALAVRVAARAVEGAANRELIRVLADALSVPPSAVTLLGGAQARRKRLHVAGLDLATARARLATHLN